MITELSHFNLNVAILSLFERSYRLFSDINCMMASQLILTTDRLLSDLM